MPKRKTQKLTIQNFITKLKGYRPDKKIALAILIFGLLILIFYKKNLILAAMVNGQPITTFEVNQRLSERFKDQVLEQMINEKILEQEANKKGISISKKQVDDKIAEVENQYGGREVFDSLLKQQGLIRDAFIRQTKLQLLVEKFYIDEIQPTDSEIEKFIKENKNLPEATDEAKFKETARNTLRQQKLAKVFQERFQQLKQQAKIQIF